METARPAFFGILAIAVLTAVALAAASPAVAGAEEPPDRDGYVTELEGICKPRALATQRAMKGARADMSAERFVVAATKFAAADRIFGGTVKRISAVPRPPDDVARLRKWFGYLNRQQDYLGRIVAELRADRGVPAQRLVSRFIHNGNLANEVVLAFGFEYCAFKFSRYG